MARPIRALERGVQQIGAGHFDYRIRLATGDELEWLAERVNAMAAELAASQEKTERIARLRRFLAPQVAELVERAGGDHLLDGQRREVVAVFGDLRDFTGFAAHAAPEVVMGVLGDYYGALGAVVTRHGATLTGFAGDGFMVLVNAPVACPEPAATALRLAIEMQQAVQRLILGWRAHGHGIGFGVGLAMGPATVGRIGYDDRMDYTAIGNTVNLAARLCAAAADGQILCDESVARAAEGQVPLKALGSMAIRGFEDEQRVFAIAATLSEPVRGAPSLKTM
jgi:class 3 adenylate cyclase